MKQVFNCFSFRLTIVKSLIRAPSIKLLGGSCYKKESSLFHPVTTACQQGWQLLQRAHRGMHKLWRQFLKTWACLNMSLD